MFVGDLKRSSESNEWQFDIGMTRLRKTSCVSWLPAAFARQIQGETRIASTSSQPGLNPYVCKVSKDDNGRSQIAEDHYLAIGNSTDDDNCPNNLEWCAHEERFISLAFNHKLQVLDMGAVLKNDPGN